jgi:uncharacterized membrane protein
MEMLLLLAAVIIILPIVLLVVVVRLSARVRQLEDQLLALQLRRDTRPQDPAPRTVILESLRRRQETPQPAPEPTPPTSYPNTLYRPPEPPQPPPATPVYDAAPAQPVMATPAYSAAPAQPTITTPATEAAPAPPPKPAVTVLVAPEAEPVHDDTPAPPRTRPEWEVLIGGNVFNIIGAIALILAMVYFLKLAFDNNWIVPQVRVITGFVLGAALIVGGDRLVKRHMEIFATGLIGAGIAILYISAYATYGFQFRLVPLPAAFACMSAVTVVTLALAMRFNLLTITFLGWFGGFVTPLLLNDGGGNLPGLFTYLALLDAGILYLTSLRDRWVVLEPLTLVATYGLYFLAVSNVPHDMAVPTVFLLLFWALFAGAEVIHALRRDPTLPVLRYAGALGNLALVLLGLYLLPVPRAWLAPILAGMGGLYLLPLIRLQPQTHPGGITERYTLCGVLLLALAVHYQLPTPWAIIVWALMALTLVWLGLPAALPYVWQAGLLLFGVALARLYLMPGALATGDTVAFTPVLHLRFLVYLILGGSLTGATVLFSRYTEGELREFLRGLLQFAAVGVVFTLLTVETNDIFRRAIDGGTEGRLLTLAQARSLTFATLWCLFALPLVWIGSRPRLRVLYYLGLIIAALGVLTAAWSGWHYDAVLRYVPVLNLRAITLVLIAAGSLWMARRLLVRQEMPPGTEHVAIVARWTAVALVWETLTAEIIDLFAYTCTAPTFAGLLSEHAMAFLHAGAWASLAGVLLWRGLRRNVVYQWQAGLLLLTLAAGRAFFLYDDTFPEIATFLPLINLRTGMLALIIAAAGVGVTAAAPRRPEIATYLRIAWMGVALAGLSLDVNDLLSRLAGNITPFLGMMLFQVRCLALAVTGAAFGVVVLWRGLAAAQRTLFTGGCTIVAVAALVAGQSGFHAYMDLAYQPVLNLRAAAMVAMMLLCGTAAVLLHRKRDAFDAAPLLAHVAQWVTALLVFETVTAEILDYYRQRFAALGEMDSQAGLAQFMLLAAFWTAYSLPLVWHGLRKRLTLELVTGLAALGLGIVAVAVRGYAGAEVMPLLGFRAVSMLFVVVALLVQEQWLLREEQAHPWTKSLVPVFQVIAGVLVFELISVETRDLFRHAMAAPAPGNPGSVQHHLYVLANMQQLTISLGWLLYSIGVMAYGLWRRLFHMRLIAFIVFGIVIVKVFFFDLSFLDTLYRTFSFFGLAVILFAVSYLFQRFKGVLVEGKVGAAPAPTDP